MSARAAARACGLSPAAAGAAVRVLLSLGLIVRDATVVALGAATEVRVLRSNVRHPRWSDLLPMLRRVIPRERGLAGSSRLPAAVRHAFWNVDADTYRTLTVSEHGAFIATRALTTGDPALLAFAASSLEAKAWEAAARVRGLTAGDRATARNLAGAAR